MLYLALSIAVGFNRRIEMIPPPQIDNLTRACHQKSALFFILSLFMIDIFCFLFANGL
jgi:hypothetical protein